MSLTSCLYYPSETPLHSPQCFYNLHGHTYNLIWIIASLPSLSALYQTGIIDFEQISIQKCLVLIEGIPDVSFPKPDDSGSDNAPRVTKELPSQLQITRLVISEVLPRICLTLLYYKTVKFPLYSLVLKSLELKYSCV